ncbi:hypothetical protein [Nonomuraea sp. NPDC049141]|uniref:hypothetical protein n=1 Tax=Nonomuraea sp. NPDC049141 TaxID=3155500 RepID=UPI0033CDAC10
MPLLIDAAKGVLAGVRAAVFEEANASGLSLAEIGRRVGIGRAKVSEAIKDYGSARTGRRPAALPEADPTPDAAAPSSSPE